MKTGTAKRDKKFTLFAGPCFTLCKILYNSGDDVELRLTDSPLFCSKGGNESFGRKEKDKRDTYEEIA